MSINELGVDPITASSPACPLPPGEVEIQQLFRALRAARDLTIRDRLVCKHLHLVQSVARRFSGLGESLDDLMQEGSIGLLKAVDMFDPERGVKFSTYACHLISSQMQHYLRDRGRLIRQPAWIQELNTQVAHTTDQLTQELGRDPQLEEVAQRLSLPEASIHNVLAARELNCVLSLNTPADGDNEQDVPLLEKELTLASKLTALQLPVEDRIVLDEAITSLKTLEQQVIRLFFFEDLNQSETARRLGISVNYASYLLRRSITKLRTNLEAQLAQEQQTFADCEKPAPAMEEIPTFDRVTGLYTSAFLRTRIMDEIARGRRYPTNFALMLIEAGGLAGDLDAAQPTIITIGQLFRQYTRIIDMTAYWGGTRFALLLPHTGREARVLAERLQTKLPAAFPDATGEHTAVNLHIGFAVYPMDGATAKSLVARATAALENAIGAAAAAAAEVSNQ